MRNHKDSDNPSDPQDGFKPDPWSQAAIEQNRRWLSAFLLASTGDRFATNDPGISYVVQTRGALSSGDWTAGALNCSDGTWTCAHESVTIVSQTENAAGEWSLTLRLPEGEDACFFRIKQE